MRLAGLYVAPLLLSCIAFGAAIGAAFGVVLGVVFEVEASRRLEADGEDDRDDGSDSDCGVGRVAGVWERGLALWATLGACD